MYIYLIMEILYVIYTKNVDLNVKWFCGILLGSRLAFQ